MIKKLLKSALLLAAITVSAQAMEPAEYAYKYQHKMVQDHQDELKNKNKIRLGMNLEGSYLKNYEAYLTNADHLTERQIRKIATEENSESAILIKSTNELVELERMYNTLGSNAESYTTQLNSHYTEMLSGLHAKKKSFEEALGGYIKIEGGERIPVVEFVRGNVKVDELNTALKKLGFYKISPNESLLPNQPNLDDDDVDLSIY